MTDDFFANFLNLFLACVGMECRAVFGGGLGSKVGLQVASFYSPFAKVSKFEPEKFNA